MPAWTASAKAVLGAYGATMLLAACAGVPAPRDAGAPADPTVGPSTTVVPSTTARNTGAQSPRDRPDPEQEKAMISFAVEGGFANQMRSLRIDSAGQAQADLVGRRVRGKLDTARVAQIVAELDASGLFDRDRTYPPPAGGADLQRYEITYDDATVVAHDTTVPPELTEAIRLLEDSLRDVQG